MAKPTRVTFEVTGSGEFPFDMLRYDGCFPARSQDVRAVAERPLGLPVPRTVRLIMPAAGGYKENPTAGRWASFGWPVNPDSVVKE